MDKKLFVYARPNTMKEHKFSDSVAICWADNQNDAIEKFSALYEVEEKYVSEVQYNSYNIAILTDY